LIKKFTLQVYLLRCTCGEEAEVTVILEAPTDFEEVELLATEEAGWSEMGACPVCERQNAIEEAADKADYDRRAGMESAAEYHSNK
jgi:hypothetical protein